MHITNPSQDTVEIVPNYRDEDTIRVRVQYEEKPAYFVLDVKPSNLRITGHFYTFDGSHTVLTFFNVSDTDTNKIDFVDITLQMRGMDGNFAHFDSPFDGVSATQEVWDYLNALEKESIRERSNISGSKNVVGVFGSYNAATKNFTAKALWNGAGKTNISHK